MHLFVLYSFSDIFLCILNLNSLLFFNPLISPLSHASPFLSLNSVESDDEALDLSQISRDQAVNLRSTFASSKLQQSYGRWSWRDFQKPQIR